MFSGYIIYENLETEGPAQGIKDIRDLILKAYASGRKFRAFYGFPITVSEDCTAAQFGETKFRLLSDELPECPVDIIQKKGT